MLEWQMLQQSIVDQISTVAVPRRVVNSSVNFRGELEFESGARLRFERVTGAEARPIMLGDVPEEIRMLHNAVQSDSVLKSINGQGGHYLRCNRSGRIFMLHIHKI